MYLIVQPSLSKMTMNSTVCVSVVGVVGAKVTDKSNPGMESPSAFRAGWSS